MKLLKKLSLIFALCCAIAVPTVNATKTPTIEASAAVLPATPTGFTKTSDVKYTTTGDYIHNWGARGEQSTFLSPNATTFYTGSYVYDTLSQKSGSTDRSQVPSSALYTSLKSLMSSKHNHKTSYNETKDLYCYTDCFAGDTTFISSFYSGEKLNGYWDYPKWNREHTWPNSKGLGGSDEDDIMMLRPTSTSENSSRGNKAYGESSSYYDPDDTTKPTTSGVSSVRGDCARIVLYTYVRWGNTSYMWGTSGVMESVDILLKWMAEDPVDTWEMGRNDAVQSITGTRNVFIDYPEYAWKLFGRSVPADLVTPSGEANGNTTVDPDPPVVDPDPPVVDPDPPVVDPDPPVEGGDEGGGTTEPPAPDEGEQPVEPDRDEDREDDFNRDDSSTSSDDSSSEEEDDEESSSSSSASADGESLFAGCAGSVGGCAAAIGIAMLCAYVLKKRRME